MPSHVRLPRLSWSFSFMVNSNKRISRLAGPRGMKIRRFTWTPVTETLPSRSLFPCAESPNHISTVLHQRITSAVLELVFCGDLGAVISHCRDARPADRSLTSSHSKHATCTLV